MLGIITVLYYNNLTKINIIVLLNCYLVKYNKLLILCSLHIFWKVNLLDAILRLTMFNFQFGPSISKIRPDLINELGQLINGPQNCTRPEQSENINYDVDYLMLL